MRNLMTFEQREIFYTFLFLFGFCAVIFYAGFIIYRGDVVKNVSEETCKGFCYPFQILDCSVKEQNFFHPKRLTVLAVCDGPEKKVSIIIKD